MRLVLASVLVAAVGCGTDRWDPPALPDAPGGSDGGGGAIDGALAFAQTCGRCHGADGAGLAGKGPQVLSPVRGFARYTVRSGRAAQMGFETGMDAYPVEAVPDPVLDAMLDFLAAAPKPTTGEGLYLRYCGNCHGANAQGGRVDKDLTHEVREEPEELHEIVQEGHGGTQYGDREDYMPRWSEAELSAADRDAIIDHIASLPPGPGDDDDDDDDDDDVDEH